MNLVHELLRAKVKQVNCIQANQQQKLTVMMEGYEPGL